MEQISYFRTAWTIQSQVAPRYRMRHTATLLQAMLVIALIGAAANVSLAQTVGDFRSRQSGNWSADYTWEQWNGSSWIHEYPVVTPGSVTIGGDGYPVVAATTSSAKTAATGTTHTVSLPSGIQAGDLLLVFWVDADVASTVATPSGWTELFNMVGTADQRRYAMYRVADGSEGATVTVTTSNAERSAHTAYRIAAGSYQGEPVAGTVNSNTSTSPDPNSLTSGFGSVPTLWIASSHSAGTSAATTPPTNYSVDAFGYSGNTGTGHARMTTASRKLTAASENPGTFALGASVVWGANTVALQGIAAGDYPNPVVMARAFGAESAANVTSHPIIIPVGATGDLLVTVFSVDENPTVTTASSGWTKLGQASNGTAVTGAIFWKLASGTTSAADALTLTTSNGQRSSHVTYRIRGATGISGNSANNSSTNSNPPSHTASEAAFLWIATRSGDDVTAATAPPTSYTYMETVPAGNAAGASTNTAYQVLGTATATQDPGAFTSATEQWVSWTLAILGPDPITTYYPIDYPRAASGNGYPSVAATATSIKSTTGTAAHVISLPAGIQAGDLLLVFFSESDNSVTDPAMPSGYTLLYSNEEGGNRYRGAWYRIADGTEGATVSTTNTFAGRSAHVSYRIAAGSYQGVPVASTVSAGNGTTADPPNLTSGFGAVPTMWIAACHSEGTGTMTAPANYTANFFDAYTTAAGNDHARMGASHRFTTAASENPAGFNLGASNRQYAAVTIGIRGVAKSFATVLNGHAVEVTGAESIDDLTVASGGTLSLTSGSLTVNGTSMSVAGTVNGAAGTLILGGTSGDAIAVTGSVLMDLFNVTADATGGITMNPNLNIRGTLQLNKGVFTAAGAVALKSTATYTGRLGPVPAGVSYSGNIRMERYIPAGKTNWRLLGSPVMNRLVTHWQDDFITAGYPGSQYPNFFDPPGSGIFWPSIRWYNETNTGANVNDGLVGVSSNNQALTTGRGFAVWCGTGLNTTTAFTIDLENNAPVIATSPITLPMTYTNTGNPLVDGWNLVSNPLPSPIAFNLIARGANVEDYVTYFDPVSGNMATWDISANAGTNGGTNTIQSMQGFYLKATGSAVTTTVSESAKVSGNGGGFFGGATEEAPAMVRLHIGSTINSFNDETLVLFSQGTADMDGEDVPKMPFAHPQAPQVATQSSNGAQLAINAYGPYTTDIHIPVLVQAGVAGTYTITVTGLESVGLSCLKLEDLVTNTVTVLTEGSTYTFTMATGDGMTTPRMMLHASAPLMVNASGPACHGGADGSASIEVTNGTADVTWMNDMGQTLLQQPAVIGIASIDGLSAGDLQIMVEGYQGCASLTDIFTVEQPDALELDATVTDATCPGTPDGGVELVITGGTAPYSAAWSDGSTGVNLSAPAGTYTVAVTDANNCAIESDDYTIASGDAPTAAASASSTTVLTGEEVTFINNSTGGTAFNWSFGDGATSTEETPAHTYELPGMYTVTLTVDNGACTSSTSFEITVELSTGVTEATENTMNAWLNGDHLVVEHGFADQYPLQLEVLNEAGQLHERFRVAGPAGRMTIRATDLPSGIWYLRVTNDLVRKTIPVVVVR